jgi:hypothetical protein
MALHVEDGLDIKTKPGTALNSVVRTAHAWKARAEEERKRADGWKLRWFVSTTLGLSAVVCSALLEMCR